MKIFITFSSYMLAALGLVAQVTFNVDMACAPSDFDNVFVTGPWCGWCANDTYNTMTDPDGDGIYSVEVADLAGTVEYKYAINGFADQENLVNDMVDGAICAPITDYGGYANRTIEAGSVANDYYGTCDGVCNDVPPPPGGLVTFNVDMAGYAGTYGTVNLNGSFNGWCGSCATMTDDDGDGVYTLDVELQGGTVEYKFTVDGWTDQEEFPEGTACTLTIDGYTNRTLDVTGDVVLPTVCWNECAGCSEDSGNGDASCLPSISPGLTYAPDFTATDINGVEHNLYNLLDQGYQVILLFDATWNGPGWSYHEQGTLEELYNTYGPEGTDEIRVFLLEADDSTTDADLNGTGNATQGDWVTGTSYPIIDNASSIFDNYAGAYYPLLYTVCPNRLMSESGQASVEEHVDIFQSNACGSATFPHDGALAGYVGETTSCGDSSAFLEVILMNMGIAPLTSCTISASTDSVLVGSIDWSGNLATYECEQVLVTMAPVYETSEFTFEITSTDDNLENNAIPSITIERSTESSNMVRFTLNLDSYPGEVVWSVLNDMGDVVDSGGPYESGDVGAEYTYDWTLDLGCYTFVIEDAYGDGLNSSWYNGTGPDGAFSLDALWGEEFFNLLSYSAPDQYSRIEFPFEVVDFNGIVTGCLDEAACNYLEFATVDDGSCEYWSCEFFANSCEFIGDSVWQGLDLGVYPEEGLVHFVADTVFQEVAVHVPSLVEEPITGSSFATMSLSNLELNGMPPGLEFDFVPDTVFASSQECISYSGQPFEPGEYEVELMGDLTVSFFGSPYVIEDFSTPFFITVEENSDPLYGCTYSLASNYSMFAAVDDGSCVFAGCTDPEANNYEKFATEDDGSCDFTPCGLECPTDLDQDGVTTTSDLLLFLGEFGEGCEVAASVWSCGDPLDYQGYDYETVQIGEQCWFAENLRSELYLNGDSIPNLNYSEWSSTTTGAMVVYGQDLGCNGYSPVIDACDPDQSLNEFGRLYNWYAVDDERKMCPIGWHVPTDEEWMAIEIALGMSEAEVVEFGFRGTDQGHQLKSNYGWDNDGNGTNSSGFSGMPGGYSPNLGADNLAGRNAFWWSGSEMNEGSGLARFLEYDNQGVNRYSNTKRYGFSVPDSVAI